MIHVTLTPTERRVLITHSKQGANDLIRSRALALLMRAAGQSCSGIAAVVDYHVTTVRGWLRAFERTRVSSIFPHYAANQNAAKLTRAQKEEIARTLHTPDALPAELWTLPRLTEYIRAEFGVVYESDRSYPYLLKHLGFSFKLPSPVDVRRDDQAVEQTMAAIREEIKPFMASDTWAVLCADETQVCYEEEITRAWLPKGSQDDPQAIPAARGATLLWGPQSKNRPPSFDSFRLARLRPYLPSPDPDQKKVSR